MVSAFAARQRLVLAQTKVNEKSNEIVAIPALLDMLAIEGAVVTIDAMGCQRDIAQKIIDKKADYVLALKGNQGTLREDVELFATEQKAKDFATRRSAAHRNHRWRSRPHRDPRVTVIHDVAWLQERHEWPGLKASSSSKATREIGRQDRTRNALLHHLADSASPTNSGASCAIIGPSKTACTGSWT